MQLAKMLARAWAGVNPFFSWGTRGSGVGRGRIRGIAKVVEVAAVAPDACGEQLPFGCQSPAASKKKPMPQTAVARKSRGVLFMVWQQRFCLTNELHQVAADAYQVDKTPLISIPSPMPAPGPAPTSQPNVGDNWPPSRIADSIIRSASRPANNSWPIKLRKIEPDKSQKSLTCKQELKAVFCVPKSRSLQPKQRREKQETRPASRVG